jgi:hypothetical protein
MDESEKFELLERIARLPTGEQLEFVEDILRRLRRDSFTDHAALDRDMEQMAADPNVQRVLRNEDLLEAHEAG